MINESIELGYWITVLQRPLAKTNYGWDETRRSLRFDVNSNLLIVQKDVGQGERETYFQSARIMLKKNPKHADIL